MLFLRIISILVVPATPLFLILQMLRKYKLDATGSLFPTKSGITLIPSVWLALVREFAAIDQAFQDGKVFVVKGCLVLSRTVVENMTYITLQRYYQRKDFSREFLAPVSMLNETEWNELKNIHKQITSKTVSLMFGRVFRKLLKKEVTKHIPYPKTDFDCIDAEIVLTTSMVELLTSVTDEIDLSHIAEKGLRNTVSDLVMNYCPNEKPRSTEIKMNIMLT
ncbi:PC4 domain-containing protein [Nephila pilipes]|uniref:PC4 domain-containing protein n=1 Tax=Nephila pilipes TaxID=299642 RepID=A0A8X6QGE6_NEPPI|nr:PC4 domain-containing protein [Nephila pilipes]